MKKINLKDTILGEILPYIKNKIVLDVGCIQHNLKRKNKERIWVHDFLRKHSKKVVGIDIEKKEIEELKKQGYNVLCKNAENFKFKKKFDIIFAGELIEHLSNPGKFLENCSKQIKENGELIITTPNAFGLSRILQGALLLRNDPGVNSQHTAWYSPKVIKELLSRYNFDVQRIFFVDFPYIKPNYVEKGINFLCNLLGGNLRETMIVICKLKREKDLKKMLEKRH